MKRGIGRLTPAKPEMQAVGHESKPDYNGTVMGKEAIGDSQRTPQTALTNSNRSARPGRVPQYSGLSGQKIRG